MPKKKLRRHADACCLVLFICICALVFAYLCQFSTCADYRVPLVWQRCAIVTPQGEELPFSFEDSAVPPLPGDGSRYRFTTVVPDGLPDGELLFSPAGLDATLTLDGETLYSGVVPDQEDAAARSKALLPFAAGMAGGTLSLDCAPLHPGVELPPLIRHTTLAGETAESLSYANHSGIPTGMYALTFILLCGLFLLTVIHGKPDFTLLPSIAASFLIFLYPIARWQGCYFLPEPLRSLLGWPKLGWVILLSLALYLGFSCKRPAFRQFVVYSLVISVVVMGVIHVVAALTGACFAQFLPARFAEIHSGDYDATVYWINAWLMQISGILSALSVIHSFSATQAETSALALRERLAMDTYRSMAQKLRDVAAEHHESGHQLAMLSALYHEGDMEALGAELDRLTQRHNQRARSQYSENFVINAILHSVHAKAEEAQIAMEVTALTPQTLAIADNDLCSLLMNMLDNAIEANQSVPTNRFIRLRIELSGNFLVIRCENPYVGDITVDASGMPVTTKPDAELHGIGLRQMQEIAERYGSMLDFSFAGGVFTVRTALCLPTKNSGGG